MMSKSKSPSLNVYDELMDHYYNKIDESKRYEFLLDLLEHHPDYEIDMCEMLEDTAENTSNNIQALEAFADKFFALHPDKYAHQYEFLEKRLIDNAFINNDIDRVHKRIEVLKYNPVTGIDTVVEHTLFKLIYHGFYDEALSYAHAVWKPLSESDELVGSPEYAFVMCIYLAGLEKQFDLISQGNSSEWKTFLHDTTQLGFVNEEQRVNIIYEALAGEPDIEKMQQGLYKKDEDCLIPFNIHFLKYMKRHYGLPFMISDMCINLLLKRKLFGKSKCPGAFFYIEYNNLDKHITERYDTFLGSNRIELFGKTWGLHYVYEFLAKYEFITEPYYTLMRENIAFLKKEFMCAVATDLWRLNFVNAWPQTESMFFSLPKNAFLKIDRDNHNKAVDQIQKLMPELPGKQRIEEEI